jgi:hypothetical protein
MAAILFGALAPRVAQAQATIGTPLASGDQLIFFYDARPGRTPFLSVSNPSSDAINVQVAYYNAALDTILGEEVVAIEQAGNLVIDPTSSTTAGSAGGVAVGNAGLAVITPVAGPGSSQAVVPPAPLTGNFTLANVTLGSAFGENAIGRLAVNGSGGHASAGQNVNGSTIRYQRFTPEVLMVPVFFNPNSLGAPENDGNRVILAAFNDVYTPSFGLTPLSDNPTATFFNRQGVQFAPSNGFAVSGVLLSNLQEVSGGASFNSSGKVFFDVNAGGGNVFGIFSQSQGPFASGQRMPAVDAVPTGAPAPSFSADVQPIFTSQCATSTACHVAGNVIAPPVNPMDLGAGAAYAQIVGVVSSEGPPAPRVAPGNPDGSYMIQKLTGVALPQMPLNLPPLPQDQIDTIRNWIAAGAPNN